MGQQFNKFLFGTAFVAIAFATSSPVAHAQAAASDRPISVSIPPQRLSDALRQLAEASGLQLIYDTKITDGKSSPGVAGTLSGKAALAKLLAGSSLSFQFSGDMTVIITADAGGAATLTSDGVDSVGVVNVEGVSGTMPYGGLVSPVNGTNGSRDVEATEGTGSYTTGATSIATKIPMTLRETPQSVSVVTAQQIQDQSLISVKDILERLPGITSTPGPNGEEFNVYSRGFQVTTFTFDGGAPISFAYGNRPAIDMSEFDSVQLVRGADGLFGGYGNPGGVVNLVRKKPLDQRQITYGQDIGSFQNFREELDVTGPLTADHKLRARAVIARQDNKYFYDVADSHRTSAYLSLEYDLTPRTLLTFGGSYYQERNTPNQGGLPRYTDGTAYDWPISTCLCIASNFDRSKRKELFATLNHQFNNNLSLKINSTYNDQTVNTTYYGVQAAISKNGSSVGSLGGYGSINPSKQIATDFTLTGALDFLNRHHQFVVGGNYIYANNDGGSSTNYDTITVADIFHFDPYAYPLPAYRDPFYTAVRSRIKQYGVYGSARLEITKSLHLMLGLRYNYQYQSSTARYSYSPDLQESTPFVARNLSRPAVGLTYDFLHNFTVYGSHQNIYRPQTYTQYIPGNAPVPPITGKNDEVGLKFASSNKKFNASVSYYSVTQNGFLQSDFNNPGSNIPVLQDTKSRGVDVEATGEILAGLQVAASYTYNNNSVTTAGYPTGVNVDSATSFAPKHKVKLFLNYRPPAGKPLNRFSMGGGIDLQSSAYYTGYVCPVSPVNIDDPCPTDYSRYDFTTRGYTTFSASVGYRLTDHIEVSLIAKNLTNVKAYAAAPFQNVAGYNFYIPPFNVLGSLHARW